MLRADVRQVSCVAKCLAIAGFSSLVNLGVRGIYKPFGALTPNSKATISQWCQASGTA
jgi:hypothetical protein